MDKNNQNQIPANWENTPESWLAEIKIWQVCPDWANIGELSKDFAMAE